MNVQLTTMPAQMFGRTVAPALAMGNACVVKPAEDACLTPLYLAELAHQEVFGPVLSVLSFDDEAAAVRLANSTDYGLMAAVWSSDGNRAVSAGFAWDQGGPGLHQQLRRRRRDRAAVWRHEEVGPPRAREGVRRAARRIAAPHDHH